MADSDLKGDISADQWASAMAEQDSARAARGRSRRCSPSSPAKPAAAGVPGRIDMILDIPVQLTVELGRTKIPIRNLLQLAQGSVVELDRLAGEPMDVLVNGCLIAQGEVVVVNDKFGIRLTDVIAPDERLRRLQSMSRRAQAHGACRTAFCHVLLGAAALAQAAERHRAAGGRLSRLRAEPAAGAVRAAGRARRDRAVRLADAPLRARARAAPAGCSGWSAA